MNGTDIVMPMFGQAMEFGVLVEWLAADGAAVVAGQPIASIESDKATYEIEAPVTGILTHAANIGAEVPVGDMLGVIGEGVADTAAASSPPSAPSNRDQPATPPSALPVASRGAAETEPGEVFGRPLASPKAHVLARETGVDLAKVARTRADGVIVAADVERHRNRPSASQAPALTLTPLRKSAARRLTQSWTQAPHFTQMIEIDASALVNAQAAIRAGRLGCSLNDVLIRAAALTVAEFPDINASWQDDALVPLPGIAVGLAVATEAGLAVPLVRDAGDRSLEAIASETKRLIDLGRQGRIAASDMGRASLTLSNLGRYGVAFGTPVLNLGEPILLFVGAIEEKAVGVDGEIVLQPRSTLSICYDHRVVDGLRAALFSQALKGRLESLTDVITAETDAPAQTGVSAGPRFAEGRVSLHLGGSDVLFGAKDARLLAIAAALAALTAELPKAGPTARKLRGVEIRIEDGTAATLLCESETQVAVIRRAIDAADIAAYSTAVLRAELRPSPAGRNR